MKLSYPYFIALRYLKSRRRRKTLSFSTAVSLVGVALGVMALVIVLSVMSGFHDDLQKKILGVSTHVILFNSDGKFTDYLKVKAKVEEFPHVTAASPFVLGQVMASHGKSAQGVFIRGVLPDMEERTTDMKKYIKVGSIDDLKKTERGIVIGKDMAGSLGVTIGDDINIISPVGEIGPLGMIPKTKQFKVVGIFEVGMYEYDAGLAVTTMKSAQDFFGLGDAATGMEVKVDDIYRAASVRSYINKTMGYPYYAKDWMQMNKNLFSALKLEKLTMFIILTLIILVAAFNIISTLTMNVMEKEREIAILKAMGATNKGILLIFMSQGLIIGLTGTTAGIGVGALTCWLINAFELIKLPGDVYYLSYLPAKMNLSDFLLVAFSSLIISFLSTVYPAYRAAKLNPVEPLRFE